MFFWLAYYIFLFLICFLFANIVPNKFIKFFFTPFLFGIFGAIWFLEPGSNEMAPIISILFLESSIFDSNGTARLIRPMISSIFFLEMVSLFLYLYLRFFKKK